MASDKFSKLLMATIVRSVWGVPSLLKQAISIPIPRIFGETIGATFGWPFPQVPDTSILQAAPKKRTSHQKKRQRQLAGNNQQKPLRNLGRCPSCGHYKRSHTLCMNCVKEIQNLWRAKDRANSTNNGGYTPPEDPADEAFNYPERITKPSEYQEKLDKKDYILSRPRTLEVPEKEPKKRSLPQHYRKPFE